MKKTEKNWKDKFPKKNRYFETENGILYCGNCINIMKIFPKNSVNLIITSPPYNIGIDYDSWNDNMSIKNYFKFVKDFLTLFKKVLAEDGRFVFNIMYEVNMKQNNQLKKISLFAEYYSLLKEIGLNYNVLVDLKRKIEPNFKSNVKPGCISSYAPYIKNSKNCLLIGYNKQWNRKIKKESNINIELFEEIVSGIWTYQPEKREITKTNFSKDIPYKSIMGLSYEKDIVMDPFCGGGTTAVVAELTNRRWIGIEISEKYCNKIKERILNKTL